MVLADEVARHLDLAPHVVEQVRQAAQLHDIGKMAIPTSILNKTGQLNDEEWKFVRRHTIVGERILNAAPALADVALLVRASHERHDGAGYPDALTGEQIPIGSRIIAVCDAFDAMTSDRPYRLAMSPHDALAELQRCSGTQFDPIVVSAFQAVLADGCGSRAGLRDGAGASTREHSRRGHSPQRAVKAADEAASAV
jgi:HD-GYP domain-containing protein (c-di-GMP phosphodiesterase class II)